MRKKLKVALEREKERWAGKQYDDVLELYRKNTPVAYEASLEEYIYYVKVVPLDDTEEYVHFSIEVSDSSGRGSFFPKAAGIIYYRDGRVEV